MITGQTADAVKRAPFLNIHAQSIIASADVARMKDPSAKVSDVEAMARAVVLLAAAVSDLGFEVDLLSGRIAPPDAAPSQDEVDATADTLIATEEFVTTASEFYGLRGADYHVLIGSIRRLEDKAAGGDVGAIARLGNIARIRAVAIMKLRTPKRTVEPAVEADAAPAHRP